MGAKANPKTKKRKLPLKPKPNKTPSKPPHPHHQQQHQTPTIPFHPHDRILLLGEGDLSFAHALHTHHRCRHILPTTYDSRADVLTKYPQAAESITYLEGEGIKVVYGVDATRLGRVGGSGGGREVREGWRGLGLRTEEGGGGRDGERDEEGEGEGDTVSIADGGGDSGSEEEGDARAEGERGGGWDKIVFNFPHVGGKTKDVNRQVRYNQELLVSFFKAAIPLLALSAPTAVTPPGTNTSAIIVTLFESEPYPLWNIRDLARHVGLKVSRSFKFQASAYPGYRHARTLGNVDGVVGGCVWRGEERAARTYVFEVEGRDRAGGQGSWDRIGGGVRREKRKRGESDDDEDD